jgi:hypothetical protein
MSAEFRPLGPDLYERLVERFGAVKVAHEGEEIVAEPRVDPATGNINWEISQRGEQYFINCPFCNDTRQRLAISYCYGEVDPVTMHAATWLANCFNESCLCRDTPFAADNRHELEELIFGLINRQDRIGKFRTEPGRVLPKTLTEVQLPGTVLTLDRLGRNHPAVRYVESRGYDAARLGARLGVGYCTEAHVQYPRVQGRIIIPIVMGGTLVGWQGRYVGDLDWKAHRIPKYYNLPKMPKTLMLYNLDHACRGRIVVVVEGVPAVWTLGDAAVAVLGHDISPRQRDLLTARWAKRGSLLVLILDPDAQKQADSYYPGLEKVFFGYEGGAALRMTTPPGRDPGDFDRETIWDMIYAAGDRAGIDVASYI